MTADPTIDVRLGGRIGEFDLDVTFSAPPRGVTALFGPSGSGKTTVLRAIAGLQQLAGRVSIAGEVWQDDQAGVFRPTHTRAVGYVFQEASLFAHLSVRDNLLYGHRRALRAGAREAIAVDEVIALLGLGPLLARATINLSGGERQRVSVGRAMLAQPRLLLMDEPLSALDRAARDEILPYFEALHAALAIPILYVSHELPELERLADTLVLLSKGRVQAAGPLGALETDPTLPLLGAADASVTLDGRVASFDQTYALTTLAIPGGSLVVPGQIGATGTHRRLRVRAADVSFSRGASHDSSILNSLPARILSITPQDSPSGQVNLVVALGGDGTGAHVVGRITRKSQDRLELVVGAAIHIQIKTVVLVAGR
ncbi:MAG: molybdenum ABC transporter ATP-binding protein [Alphaproteobacteria bacterium]|nr:molybdenum ABC transporter ATP-binding protein [Alphaproteobacteria bacterium]